MSAHPVIRRDPSVQRQTTASQRGPVIGMGFASLNTSELGYGDATAAKQSTFAKQRWTT